MNRHIWEFTNPSDKTTVAHTNFEAAALAALIVGGGRCGLSGRSEGAPEMPIFLFGGAEEWFQKTFGRGIEASIEAVPKTEIADALDSFLLGDLGDRQIFDLECENRTPEQIATYRELLVRIKRTSLNNICGYAWKMAGRFRAEAAAPPGTGETGEGDGR